MSTTASTITASQELTPLLGPRVDVDVEADDEGQQQQQQQPPASASASDNQVRYMLLLPLLLCHMTVSTMGLNPLNQFVLLRVCSVPEYAVCAKDPAVQRSAAFWVQAISLAIAVPTFFVSPLLGLLLDKVGRRPILFLPFIAVLLPSAAVLLIKHFDLSLWLLVAADLVKGLLGGNAVFVMAVYSMMADLTTGETRTRMFYLKEAFSLFGFSFGPFIGGLIYDRLGLEAVFTTIVIAESCILLYAFLFIKETLPESKRKPFRPSTTTPTTPSNSNNNTEQDHSDSLNPLIHLSHSIKSLSKLFSTRTPTIFALINATGALTQSGYTFIFFFVPSKRFGWDSYESGRFLMVGSFCRFAYFAFVVPSVIWWFHQGRDAAGKVGVELNVIRAGLVTYVVTLCAYGLVQEGWEYYCIIPFYSFASSALPTLRSLLSKTIPQDSQGRLFASLEVLQSSASLLSHIVMPFVFRQTVGTVPEAMCYIVAGMWGFALLGTFFVRVEELVVNAVGQV
ncbi:MFS general substrate transporter [Rhizoclosmatium globosum]|uniref:MFS general substrate transporter n=1 Tax=Rhizoclosmatium globosum TaxID=329046 RepID=A0A1Y2BNQ6_9FUNG|nr:MFS general substrate transporter [Rhizoclosmatium globosum]|eukprot:ORY36207.1 MFS general substrate transporter [Rhizoclosmatium globosum]